MCPRWISIEVANALFEVFLGSPHASTQTPIKDHLGTRGDSNRTQSCSRTGQIAGSDKQSTRFTPKRHRPDGHYIRVYFCRETSSPCPGARVRTCSSYIIAVPLQAYSIFLFRSNTYGHFRYFTSVACGLWSLNIGFQILLRNITLFRRRYLKSSQEPISSVR